MARSAWLVANRQGHRLVADEQVPGDAAHGPAAESAQADFAPFQRRIMPFETLIR
jgi:hypothetical protein